MTMTKKGIQTVVKVDDKDADEDPPPLDESTPLLQRGSKSTPSMQALQNTQMFTSFRRRTTAPVAKQPSFRRRVTTSGSQPKLLLAESSIDSEKEKIVDEETPVRAITTTGTSTTSIKSISYRDLNIYHFQDDQLEELPPAQPAEALAPLFPNGGIGPFAERKYVPYREASLVKSVPAFPPYRRKARHRSFYLWWTNEFRHWWKSSRLLVRLGGLYVYSFDPVDAPRILLLDPTKNKSLKKYFKFAKRLGQGGPQMRIFVQTVKPFTRTMRILVGTWRWIEAAPCRRGEVGLEEFMAFVGNRVSRMFARTATDALGLYFLFPLQRFLFRQDILDYPSEYHPISLCVCIGIIRAVSPYAASFQGSRLGRVLTRHFFASSKNRWLPVQKIGELNLLSDDCQEKDEVTQTADLVIIARDIAKALGVVQTSTEGVDVVRQHEALLKAGFHQVGAGSGGYAVYHSEFKFEDSASPVESTTIQLHVTPYGPSITDVMPYYVVLEFETSQDRRDKWSETLASSIWRGPPVLEGYCYQGAFFSPHHFAELKEMYDKQLQAYEFACKKLPIQAKTHRPVVPSDLPTLKKFLEAGKRNRKRNKNKREYNELQKVVRSVAKEILYTIKKDERRNDPSGSAYAPKGVILYFEGLDCSGKSSTGGLVQASLEQAGYDVGMRQYNRPPTAEQRMRPWMDRFEVPGENKFPSDTSPLDLTSNANDGKADSGGERIGLVWDRGPAGDFVYGNLNELPAEEKLKRYQEFLAFDKECRDKDILFLKLLFVTNRDSIAKTLGKRLAQKKMAQDLQTWLQACRSRSGSDDVSLEGLAAVAAHIDPTDFIAFNNYERNLRIFSNFAMNTDSESNPWVVVNTGDRYAARKALMQAFRVHLEEFRSRGSISHCCDGEPRDQGLSPGIGMDAMMKINFHRSWRHSLLAWITFMGLLLLAFIYAENTEWTDTWFPAPTHYNITELLEGGGNDDMVPLSPGKPSKKGAANAEVVPTAKTGKKEKETPQVVNTDSSDEDFQDSWVESKAKKADKKAEETDEEPPQDENTKGKEESSNALSGTKAAKKDDTPTGTDSDEEATLIPAKKNIEPPNVSGTKSDKNV